MAVSLSKGSKVSLSKEAAGCGVAGEVRNILVGLGWDVKRYDGGEDFDLDSSAFMLGDNGKCSSSNRFVYYGNTEDKGVTHMGDSRTGAGDGDDEIIKIDLSAIPEDVTRIAFTVTIYKAEERGQNFGQVENAYIRVADENSKIEFIRYDLGEDFSIENALVVGELYKNNGEWKFNAIGQGFAGGLQALCNNYGIDVN